MGRMIFSGSQVRVLVDGIWYICSRTHRDRLEYWSVANAKKVAEFLLRNGYEVTSVDDKDMPNRIEVDRNVFNFKGDTYHLNQCEDLIEWTQESEIGEFSYYYDKIVFHTSDGFVAAYRDDINNNWKI